jgi:acyl carrier protein phosphodiesterase
MNYLAHAYLSFNEPEILAGNMISDFVKGKKKFDYSLTIQQGIALHRAIDQFTDFHPVTQEAKSYFKKDYRLYSGAFFLKQIFHPIFHLFYFEKSFHFPND